jgi:hypothetical protein
VLDSSRFFIQQLLQVLLVLFRFPLLLRLLGQHNPLLFGKRPDALTKANGIDQRNYEYGQRN